MTFLRTFDSEVKRLRGEDPTLAALADVAQALAQVSSIVSDTVARVDRLERAVALLAADDSTQADTRLDIGLMFLGGEPE